MDLIYPTCCILLTFFVVLRYSVLAASIWCCFSVLMAQECVTYFAKPQISRTHQPVVISAREHSTLWMKPAWDDPGMLLCNVGVLKTVQCTAVWQQCLVPGWLGPSVTVRVKVQGMVFSLGVYVRHPGLSCDI